MRIYHTLWILLLLFQSCSDSNPSPTTADPSNVGAASVSMVEEIIDMPEVPEQPVSYREPDPIVEQAITALQQEYSSIPFFVHPDGQYYYVVANGKTAPGENPFGGSVKYGLVNEELTSVLPVEYKKIANPNQTLEGCFEIQKGTRVGLFHYPSGKVLEPQFDYLLPGSNTVNAVAYGYKQGSWYAVEAPKLTLKKQSDFNPVPLLRSLSFNIHSIGDNMFLNTTGMTIAEDEPLEGIGAVVPPSYVTHFKLFSDEFFANIILSHQEAVDFGIDDAYLKTESQHTLKDRLYAFFVSVFESGIDARGYQLEAKQLMVYNPADHQIRALELGSFSGQPLPGHEDPRYQFVNDSIIEVKSVADFGFEEGLYNFETCYKYFKLHANGSIQPLESNRHFAFTGFVPINEDYFKGSFTSYMDQEEMTDDYNIWVSEHLTIHDLDIMRNEIYAEYGYKFKSKEWQDFFSKKSWYSPQHENVDDLLTDLEKENIKVILKVKEQMQGNEAAYTKRKPGIFYLAG